MDEFGQLHRNFKRVHSSLMETKAVEGIEHSRKAWTDQLSTIIQDAEKSFNAYRESKPSDWSENPNKADSRSKMRAEFYRFDSALYVLQKCISAFRIEQGEENNWVVGLEKDIHDVVSGLITNSEDLSMYFIVGMKGIVKTTLANMVYYHREIQRHFKFRYWVPVDDIVDDDKNVLQEKLGKYIMHPPATKKEGKEKDYKLDEVKDFLKDKKYLVVLDNISSVGAWNSIKAAFPDSTNGSRIVITTRVKSVASHAGQNSRDAYKLPLRTKDESFELFKQMVVLPSGHFNERELSPEKVRDVKKVINLASKVVGRCGGLATLHLTCWVSIVWERCDF